MRRDITLTRIEAKRYHKEIYLDTLTFCLNKNEQIDDNLEYELSVEYRLGVQARPG